MLRAQSSRRTGSAYEGEPYGHAQKPVRPACVGSNHPCFRPWPAIMAMFLSILLLLQSLSAESEIAILSLSQVQHVSVIDDALRQPGLPMILS